ncbi:MAG: primase-helicase family protein [Bacteroidia bacterium]|jgi:hypothetical protein
MSEQIQIEELSYFAKRMKLLGITDEINNIDITVNGGGPTHDDVLKPTRIFREVAKGIEILVYTIDGLIIRYAKEGTRWKHNEYCITRLEKPILNKKGDVIKYLMPKDQPTQPFFPPNLVKAFREKEKIKTLIMTEGYFKAFKGAMHGMNIVGLSSINHMKDKTTGNLHDDIKRLILACEVENIIWLMDGDCMDITGKDLKDGIDLYKRPRGFFQTCNTFKDLLNEFDVKRYAAYTLSSEIEGHPKGLDDLLCAFPGQEDEYVQELINLSKKPHHYFRVDITFNIAPLHRHFLLDNVDTFFLHHSQIRPEMKALEFRYNGTKYKWNDEKQTCEVMIPGEANNYFRVGDQYHTFVDIPNKYGQLERSFHRRMKGTILDDHGKNFVKFIPKYQAFCNVPDHVNFQPVINNCFNVYAPFEHEPEEGEWTNIEAFIKHIFGQNDINWKDPKGGEKLTFNEYELGLDYLTLLFKSPTQILPILCLVSRENGTGKSTLGKLLKMIFTQNVAIVGNAELADNFNASWASKLLIICDEAKIDKQVVVEKVKSLSTTDKIFMNAKGKDHIEIDFFGKFLFFTNNEDNFIYASEDDVRYWIRKIPKLTADQLDVNMLDKMQEEIPAFLNFLNSRQIKTPNRHRAWFDPELLKTDALKKVIEYSKPTVEKELRNKIRHMFFDFGPDVLMMTMGDIQREFEMKKFENEYLERVIRDRLHVETYHLIEYDGERFKSEQALLDHLGRSEFTLEDIGKMKKKPVVKRYSYPRWDRVPNPSGSGTVISRVDVSGNGRPYVFYKKDFLTAAEIENMEVDPEMQQANELHAEPEQQNTLPF